MASSLRNGFLESSLAISASESLELASVTIISLRWYLSKNCCLRVRMAYYKPRAALNVFTTLVKSRSVSLSLLFAWPKSWLYLLSFSAYLYRQHVAKHPLRNTMRWDFSTSLRLLVIVDIKLRVSWWSIYRQVRMWACSFRLRELSNLSLSSEIFTADILASVLFKDVLLTLYRRFMTSEMNLLLLKWYVRITPKRDSR